MVVHLGSLSDGSDKNHLVQYTIIELIAIIKITNVYKKVF